MKALIGVGVAFGILLFPFFAAVFVAGFAVGYANGLVIKPKIKGKVSLKSAKELGKSVLHFN
ncbi:hypothetical protein [Pleomorphovibrio marinus]|uniref:hypothetical protein n=1 Tax=Pleomorphovibrio marinus TaxID=2164132 RepID=UPI000E0AF620|nr:hypothetical protein [Pleomorphovibrio marinus]